MDFGSEDEVARLKERVDRLDDRILQIEGQFLANELPRLKKETDRLDNKIADVERRSVELCQNLSVLLAISPAFIAATISYDFFGFLAAAGVFIIAEIVASSYISRFIR
jgi:uncharacterized protein YdcH (DUF465 family)